MATANNNKAANEIQALKFEVGHFNIAHYLVLDEAAAAGLRDG